MQIFKWFLVSTILYLTSIFTLNYLSAKTYPYNIIPYMEKRVDYILKRTETAAFETNNLTAFWGVSDVEFLPMTEKDQSELKVFNTGLRCGHPLLLYGLANSLAEHLNAKNLKKWKRSVVFFQPGILSVSFDSQLALHDYSNKLILTPSASTIPIENIKNKINFFVHNYFWFGTNSSDAITYLFIKLGLFRSDDLWFDRYMKRDLVQKGISLWSDSQGGNLTYLPDQILKEQKDFRNVVPLLHEAGVWESFADVFENKFKPESIEYYKKFLQKVAEQSESVQLFFVPQNPVIRKHMSANGIKNLAVVKSELCKQKETQCIDLMNIEFEQNDFFDLIHFSEKGWAQLKKIIF